jgi:transcriptional regulator with XRE-family HTH domain
VFATLTKRLFEKLKSKPYRQAYVAEHVRTGIAYQIRSLRAQRGWSQKRLAEEMGKPQSVVSRLEDPDYGKLSVQTILEGAAVFDVAFQNSCAEHKMFRQKHCESIASMSDRSALSRRT